MLQAMISTNVSKSDHLNPEQENSKIHSFKETIFYERIIWLNIVCHHFILSISLYLNYFRNDFNGKNQAELSQINTRIYTEMNTRNYNQISKKKKKTFVVLYKFLLKKFTVQSFNYKYN